MHANVLENRRPVSHTLASALLGLAACGGPGSVGSSSFNPAETAAATTSSTAGTPVDVSSGDAAADSSSGEMGSGPVLDVGDEPPDTANPDASVGCSKADFIFLVEDSAELEQEQAILAANIPGFVDTLQNDLTEIKSLHIGVVPTGPYEFDPEPPICDTLGATITRTEGRGSSNAECGPFEGGGRFMTEDDDLAESLGCALRPGIGGSIWQRPMDSLRRALSDEMNQPGACNEGFIRDDALLVIVIIAAIDDFNISQGNTNSGSAGGPIEWVQDVIAHKGREENVAVVSIVPTVPPNACDGILDPKDPEFYSPADRLITFTRAFTHGLVGDICAPDFSDVLGEAITSIEAACMDFVPEG